MNTSSLNYRPFLDALHLGNDEEAIKNLDILGSSFDPNIVLYRSGDSLIHILARLGRTCILNILLTRYGTKLNLEPTNLEGKRPLHEAAQFGKYEIVTILLKNGAQVDPIKRADWTPLMMAATKVGVDAQKAVKILLEQGRANALLQNKDGWNAFHLAAREGDIDILNLIFQTSPVSCCTKSKNGRTPAHTAALHGKLETLKFLKDKCSLTLTEIDSCGATALTDAARAGHVNIIKYLSECVGYDPASLDTMGRNVLSVAAHSGMRNVVEYLIRDVGMGPNITTGHELKMAPIHWSAKEGHLETIECLVGDLNANPNLKDSRNRTALSFAISGNHISVAKFLLKHVDIFDMKLLDLASSNPDMCSLLEATFLDWNMKLYIPTTRNGIKI